MKKQCLAALGVLGLLLSGCVAAPKTQSVTSKNDGAFQANMTIPATAPVEESLDYSVTFPSKDGTVEYALTLSQDLFAQPLPIVEVVPDFFTGEEVQRISRVLLGDVQWRDQVHEGDPQYSQEELRYKIQWMSQLATPEAMADLYGPLEFEGQYEEEVNLLKTYIQMYTVMLETAPKENPRDLCDWTFRDASLYVEPSYGDRVIQATTQVGDLEYYVYCTIYDKADYHQNRLYVQLGNNRDYQNYYRLLAKVARTEEPTQAQVETTKEKAQQLLDEMGKDTWRVIDASVDTDNIGSQPMYQIVVKAVPEFLGIPVSGNQPIVNLNDAEGPGYLNTMAALSFAADGTLIYLDMCCPVKTSQVINEAAATLPMAELLEKAQEQLSLRGLEETRDYFILSNLYDGTVTCQVALTDVEFSFQRTQVANKDFTYYYIPSLSFSGTTRYYDQATGELVEDYVEPDKVTTLLWLNAVDGTVLATG